MAGTVRLTVNPLCGSGGFCDSPSQICLSLHRFIVTPFGIGQVSYQHCFEGLVGMTGTNIATIINMHLAKSDVAGFFPSRVVGGDGAAGVVEVERVDSYDFFSSREYMNLGRRTVSGSINFVPATAITPKRHPYWPPTPSRPPPGFGSGDNPWNDAALFNPTTCTRPAGQGRGPGAYSLPPRAEIAQAHEADPLHASGQRAAYVGVTTLRACAGAMVHLVVAADGIAGGGPQLVRALAGEYGSDGEVAGEMATQLRNLGYECRTRGGEIWFASRAGFLPSAWTLWVEAPEGEGAVAYPWIESGVMPVFASPPRASGLPPSMSWPKQETALWLGSHARDALHGVAASGASGSMCSGCVAPFGAGPQPRGRARSESGDIIGPGGPRE
jgi:hypothetical protein